MDPGLQERWLTLARERISGAGLRSGAARERVVEFMARDAQCLIGAQAIADRLRADGSPGSQASVYRVLDELLRLGLLHRTTGEAGVALYEIADPGHHHHHLFDETSGEVRSFEDEALEQAIQDVAARMGIELTGHDVVLRGRRPARA
ncbi:MAG: Fur family transcriptional regulator [Thermoleophilia bacterium]